MVWNCLPLCSCVLIGTAFRVSRKIHIIIIHCFCVAVCECRTISLYTFSKRSQSIAVCDSFACVKPVLNWANVCFADLASNCDEAIFGVRKAFLNMFWECSPSSANIASDWLRAESSPVNEEEIKIKLDDRVDTSLASEGIDLFVDLREAQPCLWDPEWYSS